MRPVSDSRIVILECLRESTNGRRCADHFQFRFRVEPAIVPHRFDECRHCGIAKMAKKPLLGYIRHVAVMVAIADAGQPVAQRPAGVNWSSDACPVAGSFSVWDRVCDAVKPASGTITAAFTNSRRVAI